MAHVIDAILQLKDNFSGTIQKASESMSQFSRQTIRAGKDIKKTGRNFEKFGGNLTKKVTLPLVGVAAAAVKSSLDISDGMAKVSTIADTTSVSLDQIKKGLINVSNETGMAVTELAEAEYTAISAGIDTADSVEFLSTAMKTAKAGYADAQTTIDGLTTVLNAYGMEATEVNKISNQMLLAQDRGKTTVGEMAQSLGNVIPIASQLGVTTEELFASMATLTKNGIKTSEAITGLKGAYSNILKPSVQATQLAEKLGLNFNAAHLQSVGWAKFLEEVKEKTGGNAEQMAQLFGSVQGLNSVMLLTGKGAGDFSNVLDQMGDISGLTNEKFEQLLTPAERFRRSLNKLKNSGIELGDSLIPVVNRIAEVISNLAEAFSKLTPTQRESIIKLGGFAIAAGPIITVIGRITKGIGNLTHGYGKFLKTVKKSGLKASIFTPGTKIILILTAIAVAAYLIYKNWDKIKPVIDKVKKAFSIAGEVMKKILLSIPIVKIATLIIQNWDKIVAKTHEFIANLIAAFTGLPEKMLEIGRNIIDGIKNGINERIQSVKDAATNTASGIKNTIKNFLGIASPSKVMFEMGTYTVQGLAQGIETNTGMINGPMKNIITRIKEPITQRFIRNETNKTTTTVAADNKPLITININGVNKSTNEIINEMVPQLKLALSNM